MSSILLTNPYGIQPSPTNQIFAPVTPEIEAIRDTPGDADKNSEASFDRSTQTSQQAQNVGLFRKHRALSDQPQDAVPSTIISAQAIPEPAEIVPAPPLPEVEMPDPLPTSPFLKSDE